MEGGVSKPTLTYFHLGGKAEGARLLLELAGVNYDYVSISFRNSPGLSWDDYKAKHEAELTFGQVPRYQEAGLDIVQSSSIVRHIARHHNLNGSNDKEATHIDVVYEGAQDLLTAVGKVAWADESSKAAELNKYTTEVAPKWYGYLSKLLERNNHGKGFFVGDKVSYGDVYVYLALKRAAGLEGGAALLAKYPLLHDFHGRVDALPKIKAFYASDPYKH
jgi:glutathione S-transferase